MAEQDALPDADLQLKKRARRRLVGAIALALFAIIVLPMVMDHEPRPPAQDIQVRIPSQDGPGVIAKSVAVKPPAATVATTVAPAAPAATEVKPEPVTAAKPAAKPEIKSETKPAPPVAAAPAATTAPPASKPVEVPAPRAEKKPVETKAATDAPGASAHAGQWVVQLGAYKDAGNVKLLISKLKELGVPAYTEKFDTPQGLRTRVRAGPFATREAAEKAHSRIKIIGVDGPVAPR
jgi:DedD protein